jgi:hypothetical protein
MFGITYFVSKAPSIFTILLSDPPEAMMVRGLLSVIGKLAISRRRKKSLAAESSVKLKGEETTSLCGR